MVVDDILYYWRIVENSLSYNCKPENLINKEYKLLLVFLDMLDKEFYDKNYKATIIKMIRIKKNSIYNIFYNLKEIKFDIKKIDCIKVSLKKIINSNLKIKDKIIEIIYSMFSFLDKYLIWCIMLNLKNRNKR